MINNENMLTTINAYQGFDSNISAGFDTRSYGYLFSLNNNFDNTNSSNDKFYVQDYFCHNNLHYFGFDNRKLLVEKINNGLFNNVELSIFKRMIYQANFNNLSLLTTFATELPFYNGVINFGSSGEILTLDAICPQTQFISHSTREFLDFNLISYKPYHSLEIYNDNYNLVSGYNYVKTINSINIKPSSIIFGGLPLNNDLFIDSYWFNESFNYNVCSYDIFNGVPIRLYNAVDTSGSLTRSYPFNGVGSCDYLNYRGNKRLRFSMNHLNHIYIDSYKSSGYIEFNYNVVQGVGSGLIDFHPRGFKYGTGINVSLGGALLPTYQAYPFNFQTYDLQYASSIFSQGTILLPTNISASNLESILNPLVPYGVKCFGENLTDMYIITKGYISPANITKGLDGDNFDYNFCCLNLSVKNNYSKCEYVSHGELHLSGQPVWLDSHGVQLIHYSTGDSKIYYQRPSRIGEIYRAQHDYISNQSFFTGNLINFVNINAIPYQNYYYPTSVMDYDISGNPVGLYLNHVPYSQFVSNGFLYSGIYQSILNKQSLSFIQGQTSKMVCGEQIYLDSGFIHYTGEYPPYYAGLNAFSQLIYTTGVQ